jgi:hypothetical protein
MKSVIVLAAVAIVASCASSKSPASLMGNTNWLTSCDDDDDCDDDLSCSCGVCTQQCTTTADCAELGGSVCDVESAALGLACGSSLEMSVCLPECDDDDDCGGGLECVEAHCLPADVVAALPGGDGDGPLGCGPKGAFVAASVKPDQECTFNAESSVEIPVGRFDVNQGYNDQGTGNCSGRGYRADLLVYSCLQGSNDTLQLHSATVRLQDAAGQTILFDRLEPALPNPFLVVGNSAIFPMRDGFPSSGVLSLEVIPSAYAQQLEGFVGQDLHAQIRVHGTTVGDSDVDLNPFVFPIELCAGCLTLCAADLPTDITLDELYGAGVCRDNAGADGRICVDGDCPPNI